MNYCNINVMYTVFYNTNIISPIFCSRFVVSFMNIINEGSVCILCYSSFHQFVNISALISINITII